jgi:hypothetical protein
MTEGDTTKWVRVSTELLAQLEEWSVPVRVKIERDVDDVLEMVFQPWTVEQEWPGREVVADTTSS